MIGNLFESFPYKTERLVVRREGDGKRNRWIEKREERGGEREREIERGRESERKRQNKLPGTC